MPPEAAVESEPEFKPPVGWPSAGTIMAEDASLAYEEDSPKVLKSLSFCIMAEEKVGSFVKEREGLL